jgi:sialate O-acetylesterase
LILSVFCIVFAWQVYADIRLLKIFSNHMVVQREKPVRIWGRADAGENVSVVLNGTSFSTKVDKHGRWSGELPALPVGGELVSQAHYGIT